MMTTVESVSTATKVTRPSARSVATAYLLKNVAATTNTLAPNATKSSTAPTADNAMPTRRNSASHADSVPTVL